MFVTISLPPTLLFLYLKTRTSHIFISLLHVLFFHHFVVLFSGILRTMAAVATESALAKDIPKPAHDEVIEEKLPDSNLTVKIDVPGTK